MIGVQTLAGPKQIGFVGVETPDGPVSIERISVLTPSGDKVLFDSSAPSSLEPSITPPFVRSSRASGADHPVTTPSVTVTMSGRAPFTYAWAKTAGTGSWTIEAPTAQRTRFTCPVGPYEEQVATFEVTVTDALGRIGTASIDAEVYNYGELGGLG